MKTNNPLIPQATQNPRKRTNYDYRWDEYKTFIAAKLRWVGRLQRGDVQDRFGLTYPRASSILQKYIKEVGGLHYDSHLKCYVFSYDTELTAKCTLNDAFRRGVFQKYDVRILKGHIPEPGPETCRTLVQAINKKQSVEIVVKSAGDEPHKLIINPTILVWDGILLSIRAYCHTARCYGNFVLGHIQEATTLPTLPTPCNDVPWVNETTSDSGVNPGPILGATTHVSCQNGLSEP